MRRLLFPLALTVLALACGDNETPPSPKGNYVGATPPPLPCVPNLDGRIDASELRPVIGATAQTLVSSPGTQRTVDTVGVERDGKRFWTFDQDFPDDTVALLTASTLEGKWYAGEFAGLVDAFVTNIDAGGTNEGVYTHSEQAFSLHGIVSKADGPNRTILKYTTPIELYRFPLTPGLTYTTSADVQNGTFQGLPYAGRDTYEVKVDGSGELRLPELTLQQVLRVKLKVTVSPSSGVVTITRQTQFLTECLGEVTRATSAPGEPNEDFTVAAELRRRGLAQQ
ncbi:MAG: hypothetical protein KIT84_10245 [Labilithrix sp.]|nr:hypothetical protein [Labilithrix sp.]MCW5811384.1 hypothetical protein [Labilithrix sp.]